MGWHPLFYESADFHKWRDLLEKEVRRCGSLYPEDVAGDLICSFLSRWTRRTTECQDFLDNVLASVRLGRLPKRIKQELRKVSHCRRNRPSPTSDPRELDNQRGKLDMHRSIFGESLELLLRGATRDEQLYADRVRQGFTTDEIALDLDCSRGTVFNVRKRLRQRARGLGLEIKNIAS